MRNVLFALSMLLGCGTVGGNGPPGGAFVVFAAARRGRFFFVFVGDGHGDGPMHQLHHPVVMMDGGARSVFPWPKLSLYSRPASAARGEVERSCLALPLPPFAKAAGRDCCVQRCTPRTVRQHFIVSRPPPVHGPRDSEPAHFFAGVK